ncbi:MAG TPA: MOSC N-terminal beta barrel domain-containing protein [Gaiellaceae bacterium]|nr:MOSC N-terminal beta barrel domain-containing protein [Gaiellaceae bacterium]
MHVLELWRYPVKSMRGVSVPDVAIQGGEVVGDRLVQVVWTAGPRAGRVVTARTHPRLLGHAGTIDGDGRTLIDGHPWDGPEARAAVRDALGSDHFELVRYDGQGPQRFDVLPLTVVTDGALREFGYDRRRLRPNVIVGGVDGLAERTFAGGRLRVGEVVIEVVKPRTRCVMTTFDPDTLAQDHAVLDHIVGHLDARIALDCRALTDGNVAVGDEVRFDPA